MALTRPDSAQILHRQVGQGARDQRARDNQWAPVEDFPTVAAALAFGGANGITIEFRAGATYSLPSGLAAFPAGLKLRTNGCTFTPASTSTSDAYWMDFAGSVEFDEINILVQAGFRRDRPLRFQGPVRGGKISVRSVDQQSLGVDSNDVAVRFTGITGVEVGRIEVENYERAITVVSCEDVDIGPVAIKSYTRGIYISSSKRVRVRGGRIHTRSPNAGYFAGHNGVLIDSDVAGNTDGVWLDDLTVDNAGEHGIRMGNRGARNVFINNCLVRGSGGCGIKVLGDTTGTPSPEYHENIQITNPVIEDCDPAGGGNGVGIYFCYVRGGQIASPIIRARNTSFCGYHGIYLQNVENIDITSPQVSNASNDGIKLHGVFGNLVNVNIAGGMVKVAGGNGLNMVCEAATLSRINVNDLHAEQATGYGIAFDAGTGAFQTCKVAASLTNNTAGAIGTGSANVLMFMRSAFVDVPADDSSTWSDGTDFRIRKAGAWTAL